MLFKKKPRVDVVVNELIKKNIEFIDAPVSGGVARAITGKLIIMVGGNEVTINKVDKILNVMGSVKRAGPLGAGHAMKSLNNYVSFMISSSWRVGKDVEKLEDAVPPLLVAVRLCGAES